MSRTEEESCVFFKGKKSRRGESLLPVMLALLQELIAAAQEELDILKNTLDLS